MSDLFREVARYGAVLGGILPAEVRVQPISCVFGNIPASTPASHSADLHSHTHIISEGDTRKTSWPLDYHACPDRPVSAFGLKD